MIKKDIVYPLNQKQSNDRPEIKSESLCGVDGIFAQADLTIAEQNKTRNIQPTQKKKKKHRLLKTILSIILVFVITCGITVYCVVKGIEKTYPAMRETFLSQIYEMYDELENVDDSTLTTKQYYQKQILMLLSPEDIENAIISFEDFETLLQIAAGEGDMEVDLLPDEKKEEYYRILEEYQQAMRREEEENATTPTYFEDGLTAAHPAP